MVWHRKAFRLIAFTLRPDRIPVYTAPVAAAAAALPLATVCR